MIEPTIKTESLKVYQADALEMLPQIPSGSFDCIITDPPYESLNKWRAIGTTTRLGGHRDADKRTGWFDTITNEQLYDVLCEFARILPRHGHAWVMADNETEAIIKGFVREGETGFTYVKGYPVLKLRTDGLAPVMGTGYHLKASHEYAVLVAKGEVECEGVDYLVLCKKGKRKWRQGKTDNNRVDYFPIPWTGAAETRSLTPGGEKFDTAKPWMLYRWLVQLSTNEGETILDPFAGSGPLAVAALIENRKAVLIDKSDYAIETIKRRLDPERARRDLKELEREPALSGLSGNVAHSDAERDGDARRNQHPLFSPGV